MREIDTGLEAAFLAGGFLAVCFFGGMMDFAAD
jgi:hypothetical protein